MIIITRKIIGDFNLKLNHPIAARKLDLLVIIKWK